MKFVILGHLCIDRNITENSSYKAPGGPTTFMSKVFQQLPDSQVTIISPYGKDFLNYAKRLNIYPCKPTSDHTLVYENKVQNGLRTQKAYFFKTALPIKIDSRLIKLIKQADALFIAPLLPNFYPSYVNQIISFTKRRALKILLPQGYFRRFDKNHKVIFRKFTEAKNLLPLINVIIVSNRDYPNLAKVAKQWASKYQIIIIVTEQEKGASIYLKNKQIHIPTFPVPSNEIIDSIGAGDIFGAGFAYYYFKNKDIIKATNFANNLARQSLFFTSSKIKINYQAALNFKVNFDFI